MCVCRVIRGVVLVCPTVTVPQSRCVPFSKHWGTVVPGHGVAGTQWDWDTMGLGHSGTGTWTQWDWDTMGMGLGHSGTGTQWEWGWDTVGLGHNGNGTHRDWPDTLGMGNNGTGTQWDWDTVGLGHTGNGTQRANAMMYKPTVHSRTVHVKVTSRVKPSHMFAGSLACCQLLQFFEVHFVL